MIGHDETPRLQVLRHMVAVAFWLGDRPTMAMVWVLKDGQVGVRACMRDPGFVAHCGKGRCNPVRNEVGAQAWPPRNGEPLLHTSARAACLDGQSARALLLS